MNSISTKVVKLDLDFILDNFYKPALWGKKWTIFMYDGYEVIFNVIHIDVEDSMLWCRVTLMRDGKRLRTSSFNLPFNKDHRNLKVLNRRIASNVVWAIRWYEEDLMETKKAFIEARALVEAYKDHVRVLANELLDNEGIINEKVRAAYVSSRVTKAEVPDYVGDVIEEYRHTILSKLYLAWYYYSDAKYFEEKIKDVSRLNGFKVGSIRKEIQEKLDAIERGDFIDTIDLDEL